uniref:Zinc finger and BTB domain containing 22b n=1 Tax=Hucho hucho TaxID=62062 RepID=A0A4W5PR37_9TELE
MHSLSVGQGCSSSGAPSGSVVQVCFPSSQVSVLDSLNRQREEGQLCDLSIQVQGKVFKAHRCVLAASSPYFHDQVLLKNMSTVSIPAVMDPLAFESVLSCAYTGQLRMLREDIVNYLTVGSVLQMWHIVDKCTELLKEGRVVGSASQGVIGGVQGNPGCSSSENGDASPLQKRPTYSQPSIMPRKQWVVVKTERPQDDDLIHLHNSSGQSGGRAVSALLGQVQSAVAARAQLFPIDMQGNQILMYSQSSLDSSQPIGVGGGMAGVPFKGPNLEHGAVHLSAQGGKVFMCHCGKTFTHKSMRDRHINMHLDLRPFNCPVCAKKFKMKHHLTEHMKTHTGHKPYDCHGCGKKFMWRDSFMRHRSHCERRGGAESCCCR